MENLEQQISQFREDYVVGLIYKIIKFWRRNKQNVLSRFCYSKRELAYNICVYVDSGIQFCHKQNNEKL